MRPSLAHTMRRAPAMLCAMTLAFGPASCGPDESATLPTRETFVEAYVDLRVAALRNEDRRLTDSARSAILAEHGVTAEDLLDFAATRGTDLAYMRDVWNEIELRLDSVPPLPANTPPSP